MAGLGGSDPTGTQPIDSQFPRAASGSSWQLKATKKKFVASDSTSWRQDKFPELHTKVLPDCSTSNQQTTYEGFKKIEEQMSQDFRKSRLSTEDLKLADQAFSLLALLCKDEACACVRPAEDGSRYQAWQALLRARTARNATNLLNQLLEPTFTSPDPRINLRQWNKNAEEYATRTGERVSEGIRKAVYMGWL